MYVHIVYCLNVRTVSLNKACRFAVVFAHEGISELCLHDLQVTRWFYN